MSVLFWDRDIHGWSKFRNSFPFLDAQHCFFLPPLPGQWPGSGRTRGRPSSACQLTGWQRQIGTKWRDLWSKVEWVTERWVDALQGLGTLRQLDPDWTFGSSSLNSIQRDKTVGWWTTQNFQESAEIESFVFAGLSISTHTHH